MSWNRSRRNAIKYLKKKRIFNRQDLLTDHPTRYRSERKKMENVFFKRKDFWAATDRALGTPEKEEERKASSRLSRAICDPDFFARDVVAICDPLFAGDAVAMRIISPSILGVSIAAIPVFVGASKDSWERSSSRSFVIYFIALSSAMSRMIVSSRLDYYARPRVFLFMSER